MGIWKAKRFISLLRQILPDKTRSTALPMTKKQSGREFKCILRAARVLTDLDHRDTPSAENIAIAIRWRDITF